MRLPFASLLAIASSSLVPPALGAEPPARLDLADHFWRQAVVDRDPGVHFGVASTCVLGEERLLCAYPEGNGEGPIRLARSADGGRTWSPEDRVPPTFATSLEPPTLFAVREPGLARPRVLLFTGRHPIRSARSMDGGTLFSQLGPIGSFGGTGAMSALVALEHGALLAFFHDDGTWLAPEGRAKDPSEIFAARSEDGAASWNAPRAIVSEPGVDLSHACAIRSRDRKVLALLMTATDASGTSSARVAFSRDDGETWSAPRPLAPALAGRQHRALYAPDGRVAVVFRDEEQGSETRGDVVAWLGSYEDLENGGAGDSKVRLARSHDDSAACGALERLLDGTFVATLCGRFVRAEPPFVIAVRFRADEIDALAKEAGVAGLESAPATVKPESRSSPEHGWWTSRVASHLEALRKGDSEIAFLGDSITQGWEGDGKTIWDERFAPKMAVNVGISGDGTRHVLWRLDHGLLDGLRAQRDGKGVKAVVLMIGTNDSNGDDATAAEIASGVAAIVAKLRGALPDAKVLLLGVFPRNARADDPQRKKLDAVNGLLARLDDGERVTYLDIGGAFLDAEGTLSTDVMPDLLHLSADGYRRWADAIDAPLARALEG